jgi:hypothetical protein
MFEIPSVSLAYTLVLVLRACHPVSEGALEARCLFDQDDLVTRFRRSGEAAVEGRLLRGFGLKRDEPAALWKRKFAATDVRPLAPPMDRGDGRLLDVHSRCGPHTGAVTYM